MTRTFAALLAAAMAGLGLATCAINPAPPPPATAAAPAPRVEGPRGPLSPAESAAVLERLAASGRNDLLARHLAIEEAVAGAPLVAGNKVTLLEDGPATYEAMLEAIRGARRHVNLEFFIFDDDRTGEAFADLLLKKREEGVAVHLIYDSLGSQDTRASFFQRLAEGGIDVLEVRPLNPLKPGDKWSPNERDHRKLLIVDGRIGFIGGINIDDVYEGADDAPWRDTQLRLEGPVVAELQQLFLEQWEKHKSEKLPDAGFFPKLGKAGDAAVRIIATAPEENGAAFHATVVSAINAAERTIHVMQAYFAPPEDLERAFAAAARRGVEVVLILPSKSDQAKVVYAGRAHYTELLEAGVRIFERRDVKLHGKTIVIDGVWSAVGSANLDSRSVRFNDEATAIVLGSDFGGVMEAAFARDLTQSNEVDPAAWAERSFVARVKEWLARLIEYWI
jgi:cardiolipin synthase